MTPARLFLLLLVAMAIGSAWLAWQSPVADTTSATHDGDPLPNYYLTDLTLSHYGPDGTLQQVIKTKRLNHFPSQGTTLQRPRMTSQNPVGAPWVISAETGQLAPDGDTLTLSGKVLISRLATTDNRAMRLETRNLRYRQTEGYAETDEAVTVTSERDRIDAVGLKASLTTPGHLQFLSQVRAHYEP